MEAENMDDMVANRLWWEGICKFSGLFGSTNREVKVLPGKIVYTQLHDNPSLANTHPTKMILVETLTNHRVNGSKVILDYTIMENGKSCTRSKTFTFDDKNAANAFHTVISEEKNRQYIKSNNLGNYGEVVNTIARSYFAGGRNPNLAEFYFACSPVGPTLIVANLLTAFSFICTGGVQSEDDAKLVVELLDRVSNNIFLLAILLRCSIIPMPKAELVVFLNSVVDLYNAYTDNAQLFLKLLCFPVGEKVTSECVQNCVRRFTNVQVENKYPLTLNSLENDLKDARRLSYQLLNHYAGACQAEIVIEVITAVPPEFLVSSFSLQAGASPEYHFVNLFFEQHLRGRTQQLLEEFRKGKGCSNEFFRYMLKCGFDQQLSDITLEVMRSIVFTDGVPVVKALSDCKNLAEEIYRCILARKDSLDRHSDSAKQLLELSVAFECFSWNVELRTMTNLSRLLRNDPKNGFKQLQEVMGKLHFKEYMVTLCKTNFVGKAGKNLAANLRWYLRTSDALVASIFGYITLLWRCGVDGDSELVAFLREALTQQSYMHLLAPNMPLRTKLLEFLVTEFRLQSTFSARLAEVPWMFTSWQHFQRSFLMALCYAHNRLGAVMETIIHLAVLTEEFEHSLILLIGRLDVLAQRRSVHDWMRDVLHRLALHSREDLQAAGVTMTFVVEVVIERISDIIGHLDPERSDVTYEQLLQMFLKSPRCWKQLIREVLPDVEVFWPKCQEALQETSSLDPSAPPLEPVVAEAELYHDAVQDGETPALATAQVVPALAVSRETVSKPGSPVQTSSTQASSMQGSPVFESSPQESPIAAVAVSSFI